MVLYKHNRSGNIYKFITTAKHTDTKETLIIYEDFPKSENDIVRTWARPETEVFELVSMEDGAEKLRFEIVDNYENIFTEDEKKELVDIINGKKYCTDSVKLRNAETFQKWLI